MMPPFVGNGNFLKLPLLKCHQWTLTFISTVDVGNIIHSPLHFVSPSMLGERRTPDSPIRCRFLDSGIEIDTWDTQL